MKPLFPYLQAVLYTSLLVTAAFAEEKKNDLWLTDFEAAKALAQKEQKDVYLLFTGSDWCPPCQELHANVLSKEAFTQGIQKDFVLFKADFPQYTEQSEELKARNSQLQIEFAAHGFTGFPTVFLCDPSGKPYHSEVGPWQGTVESYLSYMTGKKEFITKVRALFEETQDKKSEAFAKKLDALFDTADYETVIQSFQDEMRMILEAVGKDHPLYSKYDHYLRFDEIMEKLILDSRQQMQNESLDVKTKSEHFNALLADPAITKPEVQMVHFFYAIMYHSEDQYAKTIEHLQKAIAAYPHSSKARDFEAIVASLKLDTPETVDE